MTDPKATLRKVLNEPLVGFAPWILVVVVEGPGRVSLAAALALATCAVGAAVNIRPKLLDVTAIIFFTVLALVAALASAFVLMAIAGYTGDGPLHQPNNTWTAWIIPIGLLVLAIKFTSWYPDRAVAAAGLADDGQRGQHPVSAVVGRRDPRRGRHRSRPEAAPGRACAA